MVHLLKQKGYMSLIFLTQCSTMYMDLDTWSRKGSIMKEHQITEKLKKVAIDLFKAYGYNNVSVRQICNAAGVARSTFYSMYSSKDDLVVSIYTVEMDSPEKSLEELAHMKNDLERLWVFYSKYVNLAITVGPEVSAALMCIELNHNVGICDAMKKIRRYTVALCQNCQEQGLVMNPWPAEQLIPMVSSAITYETYEWCRCKGDYPLKENARMTFEALLNVPEKYRCN
ncbi:TetR/AcrR family transcriptional regulator [Clostridiales Family XIII bacterium RF-744-FAT-WT-3]|uniref:TetR/AcrR family transcriptional regulator n=2 Tax=Baileyella intestinalis TaxID=2606709 RepID=A0A6A8M6Z1_9FIRM|nr:TetR/AcrR family transcriptional regulator [Baileyella intestinalis]